MSGAGTKAREAALRSVERTGAEQLASLGGLCAFLGGFVAAGALVPAALLSFWVWYLLVGAAIGVGWAIYEWVCPAGREGTSP